MTETRRGLLIEGWGLVFLFLLWGQLFIGCMPVWGDGTYYSYGYLVPFAACILFYRRNVEGRGEDRRAEGARETADRRLALPLLAFMVLFLLVTPLLRVIELVDAHWRFPMVLHAFLVFCVTHALIWSRHGLRVSLMLLPVTIYALTAVPLPRYFEDMFVERLTLGVLEACVFLMPLGGLPVEVSGFAMESGGQVLQVDDGCSGIRSLQSLIMMALFFGEVFRLPLLGRGVLLLLAPLLAFLFNTGRVLILARERFINGQEAYDKAHDWVGGASFLLSALTIFGVGLLISKLHDYAKRTYRVRVVGSACNES